MDDLIQRLESARIALAAKEYAGLPFEQEEAELRNAVYRAHCLGGLVPAAALSDAQATIARLEVALRAAERDFYQAANQWRDEDYEGPHERFTVPVVCHVKPYFDLHMKHLTDSAERARAALSPVAPDQGEG